MEHIVCCIDSCKKTSHNSPIWLSRRVVQGRQQAGQVPLAGVVRHQHPVAQSAHSAIDNRASFEGSRRLRKDLIITEKAPTKTLLRHYAKRALTHSK